MSARQKEISSGTQKKPKKYQAKMPSVAEQMAKIERDRMSLASPTSESEVSYEPLDSDALARHICYKQS